MSKYPNWTEEELKTLRDLWYVLPSYGISERIARSPYAIRQKARKLGMINGGRAFRRKTQWELIKENPFTILTREELAYIAGVVDGEGFFTLNRGFWRVGVVNTHKPLLDWLALKVPHSRLNSRKRGKPWYKDAWLWILAGNLKTRLLLELLLPYLIVKKDRALMVIQDERTNPQRRTSKS